jgi:hypothetical protein
LAAVLACGEGAILGQRAAGDEWGLRNWSGRADVIVPCCRRGPPGVSIHICPSLPSDERTVLEGIPITTVARTIFDLASVLDLGALARVVEEAEKQHLASPLSLPQTLERHRGERGAGRLRAVLDGAGYGKGVTDRELEELFVAFVVEHSLPHPELNADLLVEGALLRPDCLWRERRVIVELQSVEHHANRWALTRDASRFRRLQIAGYTVVAVTWAQLHDPEERARLAADLRRLLG